MFADKEEPEDQDPIEDDESLDDVALEDVSIEDEDEEDDDSLEGDDDEDEAEEASLEELLAERSATKRTGEDVEEEEDIMALVPEPDVIDEVLPVRVIPVKDEEEFVCANCHLVKKKVQLVDAERRLCRDCA
ncbi:MAG: hypothetical protein QOH26_1419 [Actinomycetota bacterium]|nr:hypothetical protein [Actinomycetota bacterium]